MFSILLWSSIIWNSLGILYMYPSAGVTAKWYDVLWEISWCPGWDRPQAVNLAPARTRMLQHYIRDLESRNVELLQTHKLLGEIGSTMYSWIRDRCQNADTAQHSLKVWFCLFNEPPFLECATAVITTKLLIFSPKMNVCLITIICP